MASQAQADAPLPGVLGLGFLGFPLHPAGKPGIERAEHLSAGEVPMQMARNRVLPSVFAKLSRWQTPAIGLCVSSTLVSALVLMNYGKSLVEMFTFLILLSTTATLVLYLSTALAALWLLHRRRIVVGPSAPLLAVAAVLGSVYALWTFYGAGKEALFWGLVLMVASVPVYFLMKRSVAAEARA